MSTPSSDMSQELARGFGFGLGLDAGLLLVGLTAYLVHTSQQSQ